MTIEDKKILKLLGYVKTQEDGALFEHPLMTDFQDFPQYVWKDDTLEDVLKDFTAGIEQATLKKAASAIGNLAWSIQ